MVDCPTEDVPFREGAFGGAGDGTNAPGFPLLAPFSALSGLHPFPCPKGKLATPLARCSRLRHWLRPPQAPILGAGFEASTVRADCSFPRSTLLQTRNRVKGWACDICLRCCLRYICPGYCGRTSENPLNTKFGEFRTSEVRRTHLHAVTRYSAVCAAHPLSNELPRIL